MVYSGWDDAKVLLLGERLKVFWDDRQVIAREVPDAFASESTVVKD